VRLVLVEKDELVVRARDGGAWKPALRVPLGFRPGVSSRTRAIVLSAKEDAAYLVDDGRAYRVDIRGPEPAVERLAAEDVRTVQRIGDRIALARWTEAVAETTFPAEEAEPLPFAVLATGDGRTWLVARGPRERDAPRTFHLLDATTRADLSEVRIQPDERGVGVLTQAVFSPDGRFLLLVESLRRARILDARTGRILQRIDDYEGDRMIGAAFSPDGTELLTSGRRVGNALIRWHRRGGLETWRERLRRVLFERTAPDGTPWGRDRLDPLLKPASRHLLRGRGRDEALEVLADLLEAMPETPPSPRERALIQRDLWAVFDRAVGGHPPAEALEPARSALADALARAIAAVALSAAEIVDLPAPTAAPGSSFPRDVLDAEGPWICLGDREGRLLAPFHLDTTDARAAFTVHARLPGGRTATEEWVAASRRAIAAGAIPPDPPAGTRLALVRRALLVDREGRPRPSPIVERVQMRELGQKDRVFEWELDARRLLAGEADALRPLAPGDRDVLFFEESHGGDPFEPDSPDWLGPPEAAPVLGSCVICHSPPLGIQTLTHSLGPIGPLPTALGPSTPEREAARFAAAKRDRPEFARLLRAFER
jgi:hypothetical protein